ncbi:unnamed protein product [Paramecium pentaurelia]|uniref:NACHT domain-containing protein n=1 Tax=Paramecium pentaurelia TaxID=43138 RepID=A0A8S1SE95_9CILI|nr:unnamed protein product [Paramecium pentaurelia]
MLSYFVNQYCTIKQNQRFISLLPQNIPRTMVEKLLLKTFDIHNLFSEQYKYSNPIKLRGGGCRQNKEQKNITSQQQKNENYINSIQLPCGYLANLNNCLQLIFKEAIFIGETNKRKEVINNIQWFVHNREHLNKFCIDQKAISFVYENIKIHHESLLTVLIIYLRISGFLCYQVLQICNELLRIMYMFQFLESKRVFKEVEKQDYLQKLSEFETQLEIEQAHVWKTGIEFEITLMKIMIINSQTDSTEGKDKLFTIFKEVGKSILSLSPSEGLLSSILETVEYLLKKGVNKKLYPIETYQTYNLFQLMKWSIISQLKSKYSVYNQIQQLKDIFQQYIFVSDNWILHFSWIQMITDILSYRPIISKCALQAQQPSFEQTQWNLLFENNLIHCVSYNKTEGIMNLFQESQTLIQDIEITKLLEIFSKKKFVLFSQFLLNGDFNQNYNHWNYYKEFTFKKNKEKKQEDYEIILASYEQEILLKIINNLKFERDEIISIHSSIISSFQSYFKNPNQMLQQIIQDDQQAFEDQFLNTYKKIIILTNHFYELSVFQAAKLNLISIDLQKLDKCQNKNSLTQLQNLKEKVDCFVEGQLTTLIQKLLDHFLVAIQFASYTAELSLSLTTKSEIDLNNLKQCFEIDEFQMIFTDLESNFNNFTLNVNNYKENLIKFFQNVKENKQMTISAVDQNIINIIRFNFKGEWIKIINQTFQEKYIDKFTLFNSSLENLNDAQQNFIGCKFIILYLQYVSQFYHIQCEYLQKFGQCFKKCRQKNVQQTQQKDDIYKKTVGAILTQQKQKISSFLSKNENESDHQIQQINCKNLLAQIKSDYIVMKCQSENDKMRNKKIHNEILMLFTNAQFKILQVFNHNANISTFSDLLNDYHEQLQNIGQSDEQNAQIELEKQEVENQLQTFINECLKNNQQLIMKIKEIKQYYKYYENLLSLQLDMISENNQIMQNYKKATKTDNQVQLSEKSNTISIESQIKYQKRGEKIILMKKQGYKLNNQVKIQRIHTNVIMINVKLNQNCQNFCHFYIHYQMVNTKQNQKGIKLMIPFETKEKLLNLIDLKHDHKVREGLVYNLIRLQQSIQEQQINSFCCKQLQYFWIYEKNQRVRNLLKNKELIEIQKQLFVQDQDNLQDSLQYQLKKSMQIIQNLQQQIKLEGNLLKRQQIYSLLKKSQDEIDDALENISDMSEKMDISLIFLKDVSKDVKSMRIQIDNLQDSINQISDDIRKLRGKSYYELLEIRKQKILQQSKRTEIDSVYVQLNTIEYDPITGKKIEHENEFITKLMVDQWNDKKGEINEFFWQSDTSILKDVMLLSGNAGSGKSKAARKIEEFLWKEQGINSKWIPIFVSLPTLKNPKYNLFEQALESENYQFDKYQVREFKEAIQHKKEKIVLILDSYDEMKQDCIQQNLLITNKLYQELNFDKTDCQMKVIFTTRKEILNTVGYQTWFYGESLQTLKEVQLQNFNEQQQDEYLNQYVELSVKRKIKESYEFVNQISGQNFDLNEFINIWNLISPQVKKCIKKSEIRELEGIFQNKEEEFLINILKSHQTFQILKEQQTTGLRKELQALWSANKFKTSIKSVKIEDLLTTPFMLEIVVQVLPNMTKQSSGSTIIKEIFIQNYIKFKKYARQSMYAIESYKNNLFNQNERNSMTNFEDEQHPKIQNDDEYQSKVDKVRIYGIVDKLESEKFFQNFSIVSLLNVAGDTIILNGQKFRVNTNDFNYVVTALQMKRFTVFEFYESFINYYHEQQIQKQRELGKISNYESFSFDIYQFSYSLAIEMTLRELSQVSYKSQGKLDLRNDWLKQYFDVEDEYKKLIRSCILLSAKGSTYSFTHKSIQEFYVAKNIFELLIFLDNFQFDDVLEDNNEKLERNKKILIKSVFNDPKFNISTDNFKGVINFIRQKLITTDKMNQKLIDIVKLSRIGILNRSASNSIYLLCQMNVYLGSQDFNKIELANTNISGVSLFDCNLSNSVFSNVEINSSNLNYADLSNVKWENVICQEKPSLKGHNERILEVQFSPNGRYIASAGQEKEIKLWNAETYQFIQDLKGHDNSVNTLSFSSDSSVLFSGSDDSIIRKWEIKNHQSQIKSQIAFKMDSPISKVQISQDSRKLYSQDKEGNIQILNLTKDGPIEECVYSVYNTPIDYFALHPMESKVVFIYQNKNIDLINYLTEERSKIIPNLPAFSELNEIIDFVFSHDGNYFAVATSIRVFVWNIQGKEIKLMYSFIFCSISLNSIIFSEDNKQLIFSESQFIFMRDINDIQHEIKECFEIEISPKDNIAALVYEKQICLIDTISQKQIREPVIFQFQPKLIKFSKDGSKLSLFLNDKELIKQFIIFDVLAHRTIYILPWDSTNWSRYLLSNNFDFLYVSFDNKPKFCRESSSHEYPQKQNLMERIIRIDTNKVYKNQEYKTLCFNIAQFSVNVQNWTIAYTTSEADSISLYDLNKAQKIQGILENQNKIIQDFLFSPTSNKLAVVYQGELLFWCLDSKPFKILEKKITLDKINLKSINFSPDGSQIALVYQDYFQIYGVSTCELIQQYQFSSNGYVEFSQNNDQIGFSKQNGKEILIQNNNEDQLQELPQVHKEIIKKIIFTRDNKSIISVSLNEIILWDLQNYQIKENKNSYLKYFTFITFSHTTNLIALHEGGDVELWRYSDNTLNFIGSNLFELPILKLSIINNDQQILILQSNQQSLLCDLDCFQFSYIFGQSFDCGAISSNGLIALSIRLNVAIFNNEFEKIELSNKQKFWPQYLQFFEYKQDLLLIGESQNINIWDYQQDIVISKIDWRRRNFRYNISQLYLKDEILISYHETFVKIWNIRDLQNIKLCGYHENLKYLSIQENGECGVGLQIIQDKTFLQPIIIRDIFNISFSFPCKSDQTIKKILVSNQKNYFLILTHQQKLFLWLKLTQQLHEFIGNAVNVAICQDNNYIAVLTESKLQLVEFVNDNFKDYDTFDFYNKIENCVMKFTNDGQGLSLSTYQMTRIFSITIKQKFICREMYYNFDKPEKFWNQKQSHYYDDFEKPTLKQSQTQLFQKQGSKQQLLAILNYEKKQFRIVDPSKSKQILLLKSKISNKNFFQLSLDEELVCFVHNSSNIYILENQNLILKHIVKLNYIHFQKLIGRDSILVYGSSQAVEQGQQSIFQISLLDFSQIQICTMYECTSMIYLPLQQFFAISTKSNQITFWDIKAKKNVGTLKGHLKTINCMTASSDGSVLASASDDKLIKLWNINQNESSDVQQAHQYSISALAFSKDGFLIATGSLKGLESDVPILIWDLQNKNLITKLQGHRNSVNCLEFFDSSKYLASGCEDGIIIFWNVEYPQAIKIYQVINDLNFPINTISFSSIEQNFITLFDFNKVQKWNLDKLQSEDYILNINVNSKQYSFISNDQFIYFDKDKMQFNIVNLQTKKKETILENQGYIFQIEASENSSQILCLDNQGRLFTLQKDQENIWFLESIPALCAQNIQISPDSKFLLQQCDISTYQDKMNQQKRLKILIHNLQKLRNQKKNLVFNLEPGMRETYISSDFAQIAIIKQIDSTTEIEYYELKNSYLKDKYQGLDNLLMLQISNDKKYLACYYKINEQDGINIWEINDPTKKVELEVKDTGLEKFQFSAEDSNKIYALYSDGIVRHWNVCTKEVKEVFQIPYNINIAIATFSKSLKFLVYYVKTQYTQNIVLWNFEKQEETEFSVDDEAQILVFSQKEDMFAAGLEKCIIIFKNEKQSTVSFLNVYSNYYYCSINFLCFSHNDEYIIIHMEGLVQIYQIDKQFNIQLQLFWSVNISQILFFDFVEMKFLIVLEYQRQITIFELEPSILINNDLFVNNQELQDEQIICFSPDSKYWASLTPTLQIQDLSNPIIIHQFKSFKGNLISFLSQDILVIAEKNRLQLINISQIDKIQLINNIDLQFNITRIVFNSNYSIIQFMIDGLNYADIGQIKNLKEYQSKAIYNIKRQNIILNNGNYFAIKNQQNNILIKNIDQILKEGVIYLEQDIKKDDIAYSNDGNSIILCLSYNIQVLDPKSLAVQNIIKIDTNLFHFQYSQNQKYLALMNQNIVNIYQTQNLQDMKLFFTIKESEYSIKCIALSPKGDFLLIYNKEDFTNSIRLWKVEQKEQICNYNKLDDEVLVLKFYPDGINFAAGLSDGSVNLYSIDITLTNYYKNQKIKSPYAIVCFQSFAKQSLLLAQECILEESRISEKNSIIELFIQKSVKN